MANRKSKRISKAKKIKTSRKVRETFRKQQRKDRKTAINKIDVPKSFLLTEAEKEQQQFIAEQTEQRTIEHQQMVENLQSTPKHITELIDALDRAEAIIEVLDYRDITQSRSMQCEEIVKEHGKRLYFYLSHVSDEFNIDIQGLESVGQVIRNISVLNGYKMLCIFGNAKSGKFTLCKLLEENGMHIDCTRITTPIESTTPSTVLRGIRGYNRIDPLSCFSEIFPFMNALSLANYYKLRPVDDMNELLRPLGKLCCSTESRERKVLCAGASQVLKDIMAGKINWACVNGQYAFKFV